MNVLISGGLGFIGSHLADAYLQEGHRVVIVDTAPASKAYQWRLVAECAVHRTKIQRFSDVQIEHPETCFDMIIHCASPVGILGILDQQSRIVDEIISGVQAALELAKGTSARLIHISTSEIYGSDGYLTEDSECRVLPRRVPRAEYQIGKLAAEQIVLSSNVPSTIIRPFNIVGARQNPDKGFVLARFVRAAWEERPLEIFYSGEQKRSFCDVADLVEAIMMLGRDRIQGTFNVGNSGQIMSINELARLVMKVVGVETPLLHTTPRYAGFAEGNEKLPDVSKLGALGWYPKVSLEHTIRAMLDELSN